MEALNVIPYALSYGPFASLQEQTDALTARCQGAISVRDLAGNIHNFAGDATKLYKQAITGLTWADVSRLAGGAYTTSADQGWSFAQFGDFLLVDDGSDVTQVFVLGVSTNFAALAGSPPVGRFLVPCRDFMFKLRIATANQRVQWCAINDVEDWTVSASTMADFQDFPDGGWLQGGVGGEYITIFQEKCIRRGTFIGPPIIFQFDKIAEGVGTPAPGSIAAYGQDIFFYADDGFYVLRGGIQLERIGASRVDRTFAADLDATSYYRMTSCVDPVNRLYLVGYPGSGHSGGTPNKIMIYSMDADRWSHAETQHELLYAAAQQAGYTLEDLDAISGSLDALPFSLDSRVWTGPGRLLLSGFSTAHKQGFFNGSALAATVDTTEGQLAQGRRTHLRSLRPQVDGGTISVKVGSRNLQTETVTFGNATSANSSGVCPVRSNARYHRARIQVAAGGSWMNILGVDDIVTAPAGGR